MYKTVNMEYCMIDQILIYTFHPVEYGLLWLDSGCKINKCAMLHIPTFN